MWEGVIVRMFVRFFISGADIVNPWGEESVSFILHIDVPFGVMAFDLLFGLQK